MNHSLSYSGRARQVVNLLALVVSLGLIAVPVAAKKNSNSSENHLTITKVSVDLENDELTITGESLDSGPKSLEVRLGTIGPLTIIGSATDTTILAGLPPNITPGDYLLTVSRGKGETQHDEHNLTVGAVGPGGPQGSAGPQGDPGPQGLQGEVGPQGPQGNPGLVGPMGLQGPAGPAGANGTDGTPGTDGIKWLADSGAPDTAAGVIGDFYLNTDTGEYFEKTDVAIWTSAGNLTGPQGIQGDPGSQGPQGDPGPQGVVGKTGPQGAPGPAGKPGQNGADGIGLILSDVRNTGGGDGALNFLTDGDENTAFGSSALRLNEDGNSNTAVGSLALNRNVSGDDNTAIGNGALNRNVADGNTAIGRNALTANTDGVNNTAMGSGALDAKTRGDSNTAVGSGAMGALTTGTGNIAIGSSAASFISSGSNNIIVGNTGQAGDDNRIRIGRAQTGTWIAGIHGKKASGGIAVVITADGRLGTDSSSRRYKQDIHDMGLTSQRLLALRPVTFRYKEALTDGTKPIQYGLIAEEVAEVYPNLVAYTNDGKIETVQYRKLVPLLLNELQREHKHNLQQATQIGKLKAQLAVVETQHRQLKEVMSRVTRLESLVAAAKDVVVQISHHE